MANRTTDIVLISSHMRSVQPRAFGRKFRILFVVESETEAYESVGVLRWFRRPKSVVLPKEHEDSGANNLPRRIRTCNQTFMSVRIKIAFVDFAVFSFGFDRGRYVLMRSFLVRNWCGCPVRDSDDAPSPLAL